MKKNVRELLFISRAAIASIAATGVELVLVRLLTGHMRPWVIFACVQVVANSATFFAYKYWAFGAHGGNTRAQYGKQIPVFAGSWLLNTVIPSFFHYKLGLPPWLAFASANVITYFGWNYPLNRYWVFRGAVDGDKPAPYGASMADDKKADESSDGKAKPSQLGSFIQTYSGFLSSFVIGVAGLIATSVWQWRQSEIAQKQQDGQQKLAQIKSDNDWRIERAEILSKNLSVLSTHGPGSADQRYGVLLSLTRGNILDPELAVSYALELGKDNPEYMRSVLASTENKDYAQLMQGFSLTCIERYGIAREVDACKSDQTVTDRSDQISELISDELQAAQTQGKPGPLQLLANEGHVQDNAQRLAWLFEPYLSDLYERRQFDQITRFENASPGAHLVGALDLETAHTGEFVTTDEAATLLKFHQEQRRWLSGYLFGRTCDAQCKGHVLDVMLSVYGDAQGDYDEPLKELLLRPRAEVGPAVSRLHQRLLWCQMDEDDEDEFRDKVLVPALHSALALPETPKTTFTTLDDVLALLAVVPDPKDPEQKAAFDAALDAAKKTHGDHYQKSYASRHATAERERKDPPPAMKKVIFCNAPEVKEEAAPLQP